VAQLERIDEILTNKIRIAAIYKQAFENTPLEFHGQADNSFNSYWMCSVLIPFAEQRNELRAFLSQSGIETRPLFYPVHSMPIYAKYAKEDFPVASSVSSRGINLPSYPDLTDDDVQFIASQIIKFV
jgi:perosamine synthetase